MRGLITDLALSDELAAWAAARIPHVGDAGFGPCWAVGVPVRGKLAAVVVFHDYQPGAGTVQLSMAADDARWIGREVVGRILGLAFAKPWASGAIRKVWVAIPSTAERVVALNVALGLKTEAKLRHHYAPKVHAVICSIMATEWLARYGKGNGHG